MLDAARASSSDVLVEEVCLASRHVKMTPKLSHKGRFAGLWLHSDNRRAQSELSYYCCTYYLIVLETGAGNGLCRLPSIIYPKTRVAFD